MSSKQQLQNEKQVGRVTAVTNIRVNVLLDPALQSQVRSYFSRITLITQIGGYLIFPVGPGESTVGIIVGASEDEAIETDIERGVALKLAKSRRSLRLNLIGQIREGEPFITGVTSYPTLDSPALLPDEGELQKILEFCPSEEEKNTNSPLKVGVSPIYSHLPVTASFNDLFSRPLGVIGNTGSGKSYSVVSLIQQSKKYGVLKNSKFIVLDINGEYQSAFQSSASSGTGIRELNAAYVNGIRFYLPIWAFNLEECVSFFEASAASQVPVLERVITSLREDSIDPTPSGKLRQFVRLIDSCTSYSDQLLVYLDAPTAAYVGQKTRALLDHVKWSLSRLLTIEIQDLTAPDIIKNSESEIERLLGALDGQDHEIPTNVMDGLDSYIEALKAALDGLRGIAIAKYGLQTVTADTPVQYRPAALLEDKHFLLAASRFRAQERIQEYIATLRLRIHRQLSDKRWSVFTGEAEDTFEQLVTKVVGDDSGTVTIIDCSMLAHDVLPYFCAVFGRLILELRSYALPEDRTVQPYVLVLEEAHNYLKTRRNDESSGIRLARDSFERIAKEGRKFGLSLVIASQRPSDVSATVLSQCANFIVHRIQNPEDIDYFKRILPLASRDLLDQLPILSPGDGLLLGSAANVAARVKVAKPNPVPTSDTPKPWQAWKEDSPVFDYRKAIVAWLQTPAVETTAGDDAIAQPSPENGTD